MPWPDGVAAQQRLAMARARTARLVDHYIDWLRVHENVRIIYYSPLLATQIPRSRAAHAFNSFRDSMLKAKIVRLCTLWDPARENRESIPTVLALINHPDVLGAAVRAEFERHEDGQENRFATQRSREADEQLRGVIATGNEMAGSERVRRLRGHRNYVLAHSFTDDEEVERLPAILGDDVRHLKGGDTLGMQASKAWHTRSLHDAPFGTH